MSLHIDSHRVWQNLMRLSEFRDVSYPGWTRRAFTTEYQAARRWLRDLMESAGLAVMLDAGANLVGSHEGSIASQLVIGSHTDTVIGAGRFDGMLGVIAATECARVLHEANWPLRHGLRVYDFLAEEPSPYGISTVGSRALSGHLPDSLLALKDAGGETLADGIRRVGGDPTALGNSLLNGKDVAVYLELHIEQGPYLETHQLPLGIVTGIVGIRRYRVTIQGSPGHAGTTPMDTRRDALVGASAVITQVHQWASEQADHLVATVGQIAAQPNALNVIPGTVDLGLEVRGLDSGRLDRFAALLEDMGQNMGAEHGCEMSVCEITQEEPVMMNATIRRTMVDVFHRQGWMHAELPSWAGHDTVQMAHVTPRCGMIFVPSHDGLSHCAEEWTDRRDVALGVEALLQSILQLDSELN